jgi:hypothetical protein
MNIIHGHHNKVPQQLDLEMLGKVAVVVDDLQCLNAIRPYVDIWNTNLGDQFPKKYGRDLIVWICITHVLELAMHFRQATRTAILDSNGPLPTLGLPIRDRIISKSPSKMKCCTATDN